MDRALRARAADAIAVHEQRGAAQPGGLVDPRLGGGVVGEDLGDHRLAAGFDGERQGVADDAVADAGGDLELTLGGFGRGQCILSRTALP